MVQCFFAAVRHPATVASLITSLFRILCKTVRGLVMSANFLGGLSSHLQAFSQQGDLDDLSRTLGQSLPSPVELVRFAASELASVSSLQGAFACDICVLFFPRVPASLSCMLQPICPPKSRRLCTRVNTITTTMWMRPS